MARMRMLKPSFFTNDSLAEIDPLGRLLFQGLWCLADREGRLEDRPRRIKAEVLPYDEADVDYLLDELDRRGFILRYMVDGAHYIQVVNFVKHQQPHYKEVPSIIPAPGGHVDSRVIVGGVPEEQRKRILERDGSRCAECGTTEGRLAIDHIIPRSKGGTNDDENLRVLCIPCNSRKGNRDAASNSAQPWTDVEPNSVQPDRSLTLRNRNSNGNQEPDTGTEIARPGGSRAPAPSPEPADNITTLTVTSDKPAAAPAPKRVDPIFDALVELMGYTPSSKSERSGWGRCVKELKEAGATPDEIVARGARYTDKYDRDRLTVYALVKHWGEMASGPMAVSSAQHNGHAAALTPLSGDSAPLAPLESDELPSVSLAGYQEAPAVWRNVAAELRKDLTAGTYETICGGARLMLPTKRATDSVSMPPTLVLRSRVSLQVSDRHAVQIAAAFKKAAPQYGPLRRVCQMQVTAERVAEKVVAQ